MRRGRVKVTVWLGITGLVVVEVAVVLVVVVLDRGGSAAAARRVAPGACCKEKTNEETRKGHDADALLADGSSLCGVVRTFPNDDHVMVVFWIGDRFSVLHCDIKIP